MSFVDLNSTWFRCYSKAKFSDPSVVDINVKVALEAANNALIQRGLEDGQRKAVLVAIQDLHSMEGGNLVTLRKHPARAGIFATQQTRQK